MAPNTMQPNVTECYADPKNPPSLTGAQVYYPSLSPPPWVVSPNSFACCSRSATRGPQPPMPRCHGLDSAVTAAQLIDLKCQMGLLVQICERYPGAQSCPFLHNDAQAKGAVQPPAFNDKHPSIPHHRKIFGNAIPSSATPLRCGGLFSSLRVFARPPRRQLQS